MAKKMCFLADHKTAYKEIIIDFTYIKGLAFSQKQKNVLSFHQSIGEKYPTLKILEISTKSNNPLGVMLSAFNLQLNNKSIESIYQSSKVFLNGEQFPFIINYPPKDAHRFISDKNLGTIVGFKYNGINFPVEPKTLFYDYIYIKALSQIPQISNKLIDYDIFTDIEFNEKRQINCQARSCAIYSHLLRIGKVDEYLQSLDNFKSLYSSQIKQLSLFDI